MRAVLTGARYPHSLLAAVVARVRADKKVNGRRAAICKACLARDHRLGFEREDVAMGLDRENDNPAYCSAACSRCTRVCSGRPAAGRSTPR